VIASLANASAGAAARPAIVGGLSAGPGLNAASVRQSIEDDDDDDVDGFRQSRVRRGAT